MFYKTVDSITKGLTKMVSDLDTLEMNKINEKVKLEESADKLLMDARVAEDEAKRARNISDRIRALVE